MGKKRRLRDEYRYPGFSPRSEIQGIFGDAGARIIQLVRRQKKLHAVVAGKCTGAITTRRFAGYGIYPAAMSESIWEWKSGGFYAQGAEK
jgi:hypothetical protein